MVSGPSRFVNCFCRRPLFWERVAGKGYKWITTIVYHPQMLQCLGFFLKFLKSPFFRNIMLTFPTSRAVHRWGERETTNSWWSLQLEILATSQEHWKKLRLNPLTSNSSLGTTNRRKVSFPNGTFRWRSLFARLINIWNCLHDALRKM